LHATAQSTVGFSPTKSSAFSLTDTCRSQRYPCLIPRSWGGCSQISNCLAISKTMSPFSPDGPVQIESKVLQMAIVLSDSRHPLGLLIHSNEAGKRTVLVIAAHSPTICPRIDGHCYNAVANGYADGPPIPKVTWSRPSAGAAVATLLPFSEGNCFGGKRCCVA
jgi:hypothetical protein